ncbi:MAG: hypothetical protein PHY12_10940 [Eubacteriales bacterium]|nr:hypothetical protein [Eubacteriales bacterium]
MEKTSRGRLCTSSVFSKKMSGENVRNAAQSKEKAQKPYWISVCEIPANELPIKWELRIFYARRGMLYGQTGKRKPQVGQAPAAAAKPPA